MNMPNTPEEILQFLGYLALCAVVLIGTGLYVRAHDRAWARLTPEERKKLLENQRHITPRGPWGF